MSTATIEEVQAQLPELIDQLVPGEELVITRNTRPVARIIRPIGETSQPVFGRGQGKVIADFSARRAMIDNALAEQAEKSGGFG